jgi:hypothetical protein
MPVSGTPNTCSTQDFIFDGTYWRAVGIGITGDQNASLNGSLFVASNVGIGTSSPDMLLSVGSSTPVGAVAHFENSTGSCYINPTATALSCSSDARLKINIDPLLDDTEGLDALLKLNPVSFNWKAESANTSPHTGFIAQ